MERFRDRQDAGDRLAEAVAALAPQDPVVLALPRGGVPVAAPVAARLGAPLDIVSVRKIGAPGNPEYAVGALVDGDPPEPVWNEEVLAGLGLSRDDLQETVARESRVLAERRDLYLKGRAPVPLEGRDAVVVDDGIATGATLRAALKGLAARRPARVLLAVPVGPPGVEEDFAGLADAVVCLVTPRPFHAVGQGYIAFGQTSDAEVVACLDRNAEGQDGA
ncbi:phosphoribosyltransferase family protein [Psychromarinibacter sp. C21-152]|uniref:Phosphoribosyltransferase family protein n=1 Tax=Psychromarinibacter sediminicola TaxID=3033385 RepID=A0AAE3TAA6_9RHOB|nr:phosphoribosyltransferase family protein [Psychromarinibacter sediminicola]MDF0602663.1 phosphoribosyltransferase family protein [Psychromarinibacter sediminicola]